MPLLPGRPKGVFAAAAALFANTEPTRLPADPERYGLTLASEAFDKLDTHAQAWASIAGSPALADVTLFTTHLVRGKLSSLPTGVARADRRGRDVWRRRARWHADDHHLRAVVTDGTLASEATSAALAPGEHARTFKTLGIVLLALAGMALARRRWM